MKLSVLAVALGLGIAVSGSAYAVEYVAANASPTAPAKLDKAAIRARAQECDREAEVRGLKFKERKRFKEKCKNAMR